MRNGQPFGKWMAKLPAIHSRRLYRVLARIAIVEAWLRYGRPIEISWEFETTDGRAQCLHGTPREVLQGLDLFMESAGVG